MKSILFLMGMLAFMVVVISVAPEAHAGDEHTGHVSVFRFLFHIVTILLAAKVGGSCSRLGISRPYSGSWSWGWFWGIFI